MTSTFDQQHDGAKTEPANERWEVKISSDRKPGETPYRMPYVVRKGDELIRNSLGTPIRHLRASSAERVAEQMNRHDADSVTSFAAAHSGFCAACRDPFSIGDLITRASAGWAHAECPVVT